MEGSSGEDKSDSNRDAIGDAIAILGTHLGLDHNQIGDRFTASQIMWWYNKLIEEEMTRHRMTAIVMVNSIGTALSGDKKSFNNFIEALSPKNNKPKNKDEAMHKTLDHWKKMGLPVKDSV